jgi:membrane protein DedA with SNARE-associated domain
MTAILAFVTTLIIHIISVLGYPGIIFLMILHSAAVPIPSEIIMPFAGFLVSTGRFNFFLVVLCGSLGNLIGASLIYWISHKGGKKLITKYEHILWVPQYELEKVQKFFYRFGTWAILIGRCIPVVATFISIPVGLSNVKYWKFAFLTFIGSTVWNILLIFIGYKLGQHWLVLKDQLHNLDIIIEVLILAAIVWWVNSRLVRSKVNKQG